MEQEIRSFRASLAAMTGICLVFMLASLDSSMMGTVMPQVIAELKGYDLYTWPASTYLLFNTVMIPITGRLGDLHGRKYFVLGAIAVFMLGSVLCGMSQSMPQLIAARGFQGIGGGMLFGVASASVSDLFPDRAARIRWQVMLTATYALATAVGPSLAGWLTAHASWRTVFYVNLPIALLALAAVIAFLPRIVHNTGPDRSVDFLSSLLLVFGIGTMLLATASVGAHQFSAAVFALLVASSAGAVVLFVRRQTTSSTPIVPPRLFHNKTAMLLTNLSLLTGFAMFLLIYYAPLFLQAGLGLSPDSAGLMLTPLLLMLAVGTFVNGRVTPHLKRPERMILCGQALLALGCLILTAFASGTARAPVLAAFALSGFGLGLLMPSLILQMHTSVERRDIGSGMALVQTARLVGSIVGISVGGLIINLSFLHGMADVLASMRVGNSAVLALFESPQILVRTADQASLVELAKSAQFSVDALLAQAHATFIWSLRLAWTACSALTVLAFVLALRLAARLPDSTVASSAK